MTENSFSIDTLLEQMVAHNASDLHVTVGARPALRVRGQLERLEAFPDMTADTTRQLLYRIISSEQQKRLEIDRQLDLSYSIPGVARFRVNIYSQRESLAAAFRLIPAELKSLEELGLPTNLYDVCRKPRGLVLVTGPTGSGKSTTLAALIDEINRTRAEHIITIEDPIEFLHRDNLANISQREVGNDTLSFNAALRHVLRQAPDVILIGEIRDAETMESAITFAETGHLCVSTLHSNNADQAI
ncbi:MAG TPA: PilT/PilU family type 4a pilus ATPase, partial [Gaiellaceae bacterium]|nr:PilT/PilU family type 4a pilus ATPase [Gaiellaceae bacterium]